MGKLTALEHTAIGALAGVAEVVILQPTVGVKNALQEGRPVPRSITALYRGLGMNACSNFPITAAQFGVARALELLYEMLTGHGLDGPSSVLVAMWAGAVSSLLSCPSEFIVIQQQKTGRSLAAETAAILKQYGFSKFFKGLFATATRSAVYTASYMILLPLVKDYLEETEWARHVAGAPLVIAGVAAGVLGSILTHPVDTAKTRMQAFPDAHLQPQYSTMWSSMLHIVRREGMGGLFRGLLPRTFRNCGAVIILNSTLTTMLDVMHDRRVRLPHKAAD